MDYIDLIQKTIDYIDNNITKKITIDQLANSHLIINIVDFKGHASPPPWNPRQECGGFFAFARTFRIIKGEPYHDSVDYI